MQRKIRELAHGRIDHDNASISLSENKIVLDVLEGKIISGEFSFSSDTDDVIRGYVFSSNSRMECLTPVFEGRKKTIRYQFNSRGLSEGDIQKGEFNIVSDHGEYCLSFAVSVLNPHADSSVGNIKNLSDFLRLYKDYPKEAVKIFYSTYFHHILKNSNSGEAFLYDSIKQGNKSLSNIEEYLCTVGLKKHITLGVTKTKYECFDISENSSEIIELTRDNWGCLNIQIESDSEWVNFSKNIFSEEDFIGNKCFIPFVIDYEKLHKGLNFARITIRYKSSFWDVIVEASANGKRAFEKSAEYLMGEFKLELNKLYAEYRLGRIVTGNWVNQSVAILDKIIEFDDKPIYSLMKAQLYLANGRKQDAEWLLDAYKRSWDGIESTEYGFYLYVLTLLKNEESYVNKLIDKIHGIYIKNRENYIMFFCELNTDQDLVRNRTARYKAIEEYFRVYGTSYILNIEALVVLLSEPYLVTQLDRFTFMILMEAKKLGRLDSDLASRVMTLLAKENGYNERVRSLACDAYKVLSDDASLTNLCSYLIRNRRRDDRDHAIYEKGIESNVRVAGLYEAYLESLEANHMKPIPHIVLMYFREHSHLPVASKEMLYVNIIANKEKEADYYEAYRDQIAEFAYEQLEYGRIDDSLAVIYNDVFDSDIRLKDVAAQIASVAFTRRITCFDERITAVVIREKILNHETRIPLKNGVAYVNIYTNDYLMLIEDNLGNRYVDIENCQTERLLQSGRIIKKCFDYAINEKAYLINYFAGRKNSQGIKETDLPLVSNFLELDEVNSFYKNKIALMYSDFLENMGRPEIAIEHVVVDELSREEKTEYIELLVRNDILDTAYQYIREYSICGLAMPYLMRILSYIINDVNGQEDQEILQECMQAFDKGCTEPKVLAYLEKYAAGPSKYLEKLYKILKKENMPRNNITERLLIQILFSTEYISSYQEIFEEYAVWGKPEVIDAYLVYYSYIAFSKDAVVSERLFEYVAERLKDGAEPPMVVKLAYARNLVESGRLNEDNEEILITMIKDWLEKGLYFKFYKRLPHELQEKLHIADQTIIEYKTGIRTRIKLHYRLDEKDVYTVEDMPEMYNGVYAKSMLLFFGESIQYFITEESNGDSSIIESGKIENLGISGNAIASRYDHLNEVLMAYYLGENEALERMKNDYIKKSEEVKQLFDLMD